MPSPVPKFPEIMRNLAQSGYSYEIPLAQLRQQVILLTGATKDTTIKNTIMIMQELKFIRMNENGYFINIETEKKRQELAQNPEKEAENLLGNFISADD